MALTADMMAHLRPSPWRRDPNDSDAVRVPDVAAIIGECVAYGTPTIGMYMDD
jgi:hypothetical protein